MANYILTRKDAAEELDISVRSIDRYIKSWKIRSKKKWKTVYVHEEDISNIKWGDTLKKHIIITKKEKKEDNIVDEESNGLDVVSPINDLVQKNEYNKITKTFEKVYSDLRTQIEKKDNIIQELSVKVWISQEQVNQSISVSEHNRSQMLLEESKTNISKQMNYISEEKRELEKELKNERFDKKVLIVFVFIFLGLASFFWYKSV